MDEKPAPQPEEPAPTPAVPDAPATPEIVPDGGGTIKGGGDPSERRIRIVIPGVRRR